MSRITIKLTPQEIKKAKSIAKKRDAKKAKFGAGRYGACSSKTRTGSSENSHFIGLLGEIATAKYFDVKIDTKIYDNHGDDGIDLEIPDLGKTQVKTTTYTNKPLLRIPCGTEKDVEKIEPVDTYICCCVDKSDYSEVDLVGFIDKDLAVKAKKVQFIQRGPINYVIEEDKLNKFNLNSF